MLRRQATPEVKDDPKARMRARKRVTKLVRASFGMNALVRWIGGQCFLEFTVPERQWIDGRWCDVPEIQLQRVSTPEIVKPNAKAKGLAAGRPEKQCNERQHTSRRPTYEEPSYRRRSWDNW